MQDVKNNWKPRVLEDELHSKTMVLNLGPSHPATHGTARLILELDGELVRCADVDIGYLHRGFEKECENHNYHQAIPYTDRLNYVSPIINNVGYCLAVEKLLGVRVPKRAEYIRVIMSEISRVSDHLTCLGASAMELGAFTVMLYMMQAREYLYELIEEVSGARVTASYSRIGGLAHDLPHGFKERVKKRIPKIEALLTKCDKLLTKNRIFVDRMCDIGVIAEDEAKSYGLTGPMLRACGVKYDVRKAFPYSSYEDFDFEIPVGEKGDNYDRFLVRFNEIYESIRIINQALNKLPEGAIRVDDNKITMRPKDEVYNSIEGLISQFNIVVKGIRPDKAEVYLPCEGGNGEVGFYIVSDGGNKPYKMRVRSPSFVHMGILGRMIEGHSLSDVIAIFGMMNMIGGECDR